MSLQTAAANPNKALWEKGDFTRIAEALRENGAAFVSTLGITPGLDVLDLGCGDGTTAIPEARLGANVVGVDIASNLVAAGNRRIKEEGLSNIAIREGDATDLYDIGNESFDLTVSIFGAVFAPKPYEVAKEMMRVTRKGGRIVMGNWIPGDPTLVAQILKISSAYTPPPSEGFISPMLWGVEEEVTKRFGNAGIAKENISFSRETFMMKSNDSPAELLSRFRNYYGPTMNALKQPKNGKEEALQNELEQLFTGLNQSGSNDATAIPATFLRVMVRC